MPSEMLSFEQYVVRFDENSLSLHPTRWNVCVVGRRALGGASSHTVSFNQEDEIPILDLPVFSHVTQYSRAVLYTSIIEEVNYIHGGVLYIYTTDAVLDLPIFSHGAQ